MVDLDVQATTIFEELTILDWNAIDVLKIDVQGAELDVLKGCQAYLDCTRYLILEVWLRDPNVFELIEYASKYFPYSKYIGPVESGADYIFSKTPF